MKRTCTGCKALEYDVLHVPLEYKCFLHYSRDAKTNKPTEKCPKPKTLIEFCKLEPKVRS